MITGKLLEKTHDRNIISVLINTIIEESEKHLRYWNIRPQTILIPALILSELVRICSNVSRNQRKILKFSIYFEFTSRKMLRN